MHDETKNTGKTACFRKTKREAREKRTTAIPSVADHHEGCVCECLLTIEPVDHSSPMIELGLWIDTIFFIIGIPMTDARPPIALFFEGFHLDTAFRENDASKFRANEGFGNPLWNPLASDCRDEKRRKTVGSQSGVASLVIECRRPFRTHANFQPVNYSRCFGSKTLTQLDFPRGVFMQNLVVLPSDYSAGIDDRLF